MHAGTGCVGGAAAPAVDRGDFFCLFYFFFCFLFDFYFWCLHIFADQASQRQGALWACGWRLRLGEGKGKRGTGAGAVAGRGCGCALR